MRRPLPAIHRAVRSAAAVDSGFALYASFRTRTPDAVVNVSIRQRDTPACASAGPTSARGMPSSSPTATAASAFDTMCSPGTANVTSVSASPEKSRNDARPSGPSATSWARTSASGRVPKVITRPGHRSP